MNTNTNVLIASKVHPTFKESVETFCVQHDYTLSQAIRKGLVMFMRDMTSKSGDAPVRAAEQIVQPDPQPPIKAVEKAAPVTFNPNHFGATAPV